jgi:hypothetical protein
MLGGGGIMMQNQRSGFWCGGPTSVCGQLQSVTKWLLVVARAHFEISNVHATLRAATL